MYVLSLIMFLKASMYFPVFTRDNLERYTSDYTAQVLVGYCTVYIFMQTFMIPGTVFMSLLAGSLFGVLRGVALVVFAATAGASSCYFLSNLIGRPLILSMWPDKLIFSQDQVRLKCSEYHLGVSKLEWATSLMGNFYYRSGRADFLLSIKIVK